MSFSEKIQKLRKENSLSQEELAEIMNVSRQAVSKWESGLSMPDIDKLIEISKYFGVTVDFLIKDEEVLMDKKPDEIKQVETNNSPLNSAVKRKMLGGLAGGCISLCVYSLATADQCPTAYQTYFRIVECVLGIGFSIFLLLKIRKFKQAGR